MKKLLFAILFAPMLAFAAGAKLHLDKAPDKANDMAALQNGAKVFVNYCLNCHSVLHALQPPAGHRPERRQIKRQPDVHRRQGRRADAHRHAAQ
jgi:mono/diheme cytochrome c family protein